LSQAAQRALFILTPPHTLHLQSLLDLSRADWRRPLGADQVKVTIPPATILRALEQSPMHKCLELARAHVLIELACAHSRAFHSARALEVCGQASAAMGDVPRLPRRILLESKVQEISGNQFLREREVVRSRACYTEAMRLLDEAVAAGADKTEVADSRASLELNSQLLSRQEGTSQSPEAQLTGFERIWAAYNGECSETARSTCRNALLCCVTVDQQRAWLQRYLSMSPEAAAVSPAVRLTGQTAARGVCRGCRKTAAACSAEGDKLRICSGCSGVAYCSSSCQAEDWKRHAAACKSAARFARKADAGSDAALSEALCCECQLPASAELLTILKCGHLLHRFCASRLEDAAINRPLMERVAACCPTCDTPFIAPLAPRMASESGVPDVICDPAEMAGGTALSLDDMARSAGWDSMPQMQGKSHEERVAVMRSWGILGMQVG